MGRRLIIGHLQRIAFSIVRILYIWNGNFFKFVNLFFSRVFYQTANKTMFWEMMERYDMDYWIEPDYEVVFCKDRKQLFSCSSTKNKTRRFLAV